MSELYSPMDGEGVSEAFEYLAENGIIITKVFKSMKGVCIKVNTRCDFDWTAHMVDWYARERGFGKVVNANIGDYVHNGDILFLCVGGQ